MRRARLADHADEDFGRSVDEADSQVLTVEEQVPLPPPCESERIELLHGVGGTEDPAGMEQVFLGNSSAAVGDLEGPVAASVPKEIEVEVVDGDTFGKEALGSVLDSCLGLDVDVEDKEEEEEEEEEEEALAGAPVVVVRFGPADICEAEIVRTTERWTVSRVRPRRR